jgi:hypothetical protein
MATLMDFKLILEHADMELKYASQSQIALNERYEEAKENYRIAANMYVTEINKICQIEGLKIQFDYSCYSSNKYDR